MTAIALFASSFVLVFALGFQSLNVNNGHYWAAATTSLVIGSMQMVLLQLGPDASAIQIGAAIAGGPLGIVCSMWAHRRTVRRWARKSVVITEIEPTSASVQSIPQPEPERRRTPGPSPTAPYFRRLEPGLERRNANINCGADRL